jgi:hypothetical protein
MTPEITAQSFEVAVLSATETERIPVPREKSFVQVTTLVANVEFSSRTAALLRKLAVAPHSGVPAKPVIESGPP